MKSGSAGWLLDLQAIMLAQCQDFFLQPHPQSADVSSNAHPTDSQKMGKLLGTRLTNVLVQELGPLHSDEVGTTLIGSGLSMQRHVEVK